MDFILSALVIIGISFLIIRHKTQDGNQRLDDLKCEIEVVCSQDARLQNAKIFHRAILTPIAMSEDGYIGIQLSSTDLRIFHIKDVIKYDLKVDNLNSPGNGAGTILKTALPGAAIGGILGGLNDFTSGGDLGNGPRTSGGGIGGLLIGGLLGAGIGALIGSGGRKNHVKRIDLVFKLNDFKHPLISVPLFKEEGFSAHSYSEVQEEIQEIIALLDYLTRNCAAPSVFGTKV
jgi:hypothetical protein